MNQSEKAQLLAKPVRRTYTIDISRDPSISGWGGFDQWTIGPLTNTQADMLMERIEKIVEHYGELFGVRAEFTGSL